MQVSIMDSRHWLKVPKMAFNLAAYVYASLAAGREEKYMVHDGDVTCVHLCCSDYITRNITTGIR